MKQFVLKEDVSAGGGTLRLEGKSHHYLVRVRRHAEGDEIAAVDSRGRHYRLRFTSVSEQHCDVFLEPVSPDAGDEIPVRLVLIPAITKGKKMDLTVRQAVEAGVAEILPVLTEHCQVRYRDGNDAAAKQERWQRIATEALQQCGGGFPADVGSPKPLEEVINEWQDRGLLLFLHEKQTEEKTNGVPGSLFSRLAEVSGELGIITGPEGGLSPSETAFLLKRGAYPVHLGARILRAETAALYGLAAAATIIRERSEWYPASSE